METSPSFYTRIYAHIMDVNTFTSVGSFEQVFIFLYVSMTTALWFWKSFELAFCGDNSGVNAELKTECVRINFLSFHPPVTMFLSSSEVFPTDTSFPFVFCIIRRISAFDQCLLRFSTFYILLFVPLIWRSLIALDSVWQTNRCVCLNTAQYFFFFSFLV